MTRSFPDGGTWTPIVEWARPSTAAADVYDTALYDTGVYDGSSSFNWQPISNLILSIKIRRGKERFGRRFRTGTGVLVVDNPDGRWLTGDSMFPGDLVRIRVRVDGGNPDALPQPIPPGWSWMDNGNTWFAAGSLIMDDTVEGESNTYQVFFGRVNAATDTVKAGRDVTRFELVDQMASLAVIDKDALPSQGAGELSDVRMQRILDNAGQQLNRLTVLGDAQMTMAATTLAKNALEEAQLTAETEGGDFWYDTEGDAVFGTRDWLTTEDRSVEVQATFGGSGLPITDSLTVRDLQLVVNQASIANTGGTVQSAQDDVSISRYSLRTFRRLDLLGDSDANSLFLANRFVAQLANTRPRLRFVELPVISTDAATDAGVLRFGDRIRATVESIHGWAFTFETHIIGITHEMVGDQWTVRYDLDDAFTQSGTDGGFDADAFNEGFDRGVV